MVKRAASEMELSKWKQDASAQLKALLLQIYKLLDEEGTRFFFSAFAKLPPKKIYPDYYELIEMPISLAEIQKKMVKGSYLTPAQFLADINLMYDNAVLYNDPDSWIVQDAKMIVDYVEANIDLDATAPEPTNADLAKMCTSILDEVIAHEFPEDGVLSGPFIYNVDPEEYPEYYTIIETPTSFENVKSKINGSLFSLSASLAENLNAFYNETDLIFINAQTYNDPSSLIHEDLKKLQLLLKEKFQALQRALLGELQTGMRIKIKPPKEPTPKLKLTFKGKTESPAPESPGLSDEPPKKRRGRKPKKFLEEERQAASELKREPDGYMVLDGDEDGTLRSAFERQAMGKVANIPPNESVFIRRVGFSSNQGATGQMLTAVGSQLYPDSAKTDLAKRSFFPEVPASYAATFFDYQFETIGYSSKAYSVTLPQDCTPVVSMKVALHQIIYNLKKDDLVDGQGLLKGRNEEDFMVSLFINEEEVLGAVEISEEVDSVDNRIRLLSLSYDLKLNYGLNVVNFELRLSPNLVKILRKRKHVDDSAELAGRYTRHQSQRIKLNWEVEKFTLYVVSLSP